MIGNGRLKGVPFHERHKYLLIFCTLTGLKIRAVDRIITTPWKRHLCNTWSFFLHLVLFSTLITSILQLILLKQNNIFSAIHLVMLIGCSTHGAIRQYYLRKNLDKFDELYTSWDELFNKDDDWRLRQETIDVFYKEVKKIFTTLGIVTTVTFTVFAGSNFLTPTKTLRYQTIIPYRHQSPDFELLLSYYSLRILAFAVAVPSSQLLLVLPIIWEMGEVKWLQKCLEDVFRNGESVFQEFRTSDGVQLISKSYTKRGIINVRKSMKLWVKQHQKLTKFHEMSMNLNNFEFSMEMIATFVETCGIAILCSSDYYPAIEKLAVFAGFSGSIALFYFTCKKCKELSDLSMRVTQKAFAENWSALPISQMKNFQIIIARTQKPLNYYGAYIFQIDAITFNQICQTAYSVFNFFFTVVHRM